MRLHPVWGLILFFLAALATTSLAVGGEFPATPPGYTRLEIEGFQVYASETVLKQPADRWGRQPLSVLQRELNDLRRLLVPKIVSVLQEVPVWVEWDETSKLIPGAIAMYYHGSPDAMSKLGTIPAKANGIEVLTLRRLGEIRQPGTNLQQVVLLHEMSHAVHHRLLGSDNPELLGTFQQAVDRKLYEDVTDRFGRRGRAYARTNAAEYFAEISCAYLDSCNYYPFNYTQLQGYDPVGFAFVESVWKHPERFDRLAKKPATPTKHAPKINVLAERDAQLRLDKLRLQLKDGQTDQAKTGLQDLIRTFPATAAASDAKKLLKTLN
jgi:hypothetical protein